MEWRNPDGSLTGGIVIEDGAGNKLGTAANPLNVTGGGGGGGGSNASIGLTGSSIPADATAIGFQNASGNLAIPSPLAGLPIADSGAAASGVSQPAGGSGLSGWLSGIYYKLTGTLSVSWSGQSVSVSNFPSSQTVAGSVSVSNLPATQAVSAASLPLPAGAAADGTDATGVTQLSGGVGIRGWLSGIYSKLTGTLSVSWSGQSVSVSNFPSSQTVAGSVSVSNLPATQAISAAASQFADGSNVTLGTKADAIATVAVATPGTFSLIALAKQIITTLLGTLNFNLAQIGGSAISASNAFPIYDAYNAPTSTTWTSATAAGAVGTGTGWTVNTSGMDTVVLTFIPAGTVSGGHISFYAYDGANWVLTKGYRAASYNGDTGYALTGGTNAWQFSVAGFTKFQAVLDTAITGTGSALITAVVSSAPSVDGLTVGLDPSQPLPGGANIIGYAGSLNFGPLVTTPVTGTSYATAGFVVGSPSAAGGSGVNPVAVFRTTTQPSAELSQFMLGWGGGETYPVEVYIFSKNPTNSTVTDGAAPSFAAADMKYLVTPPFALSALAPSYGSAKTFASQGLSLSVKNQDSTATQNLYVVLVLGAIATVASGDLWFSSSGVQD